MTLKERVAEDALEAFNGISIEQCDRSLGGVLSRLILLTRNRCEWKCEGDE